MDRRAWEATDWVTIPEAARRLGMAPSWFKEWAKREGVEMMPRGNQPGVRWSGVEETIPRSTTVDLYRRGDDPDRCLPGVALITEVQRRFDWSQGDVAEALGVGPAMITRYRQNGVPAHQIARLQQLAEMAPENAPTPRRRRRVERRRQGA